MLNLIPKHECGDEVFHKTAKTAGVVVGHYEENGRLVYEFKGACGMVVEATEDDLTV